MRGAVVTGLRLYDVDVLTAFEDGAHEMPDPELLDRANTLGRVLSTNDDDLLVDAVRRQREGSSCAGVIYVHQEKLGIGETVEDLELIAKASEPDEDPPILCLRRESGSGLALLPNDEPEI